MYGTSDVDSPDTAFRDTAVFEWGVADAVTPAAMAVATKVTLAPGSKSDVAHWQAAFTRAAGAAPDVVSLEIIPVDEGSADWQIIQRFRSPEALPRWRDGRRAALLADLAQWSHPGQRPYREEAAPVRRPLLDGIADLHGRHVKLALTNCGPANLNKETCI